MKKWLFVPILVLALSCSSAFADTVQMKITLVKIVNQLEAIKSLINQAKLEQNANLRVKIHFDAWVGLDGKKHSGLRQDIESIQAALINAINVQNIVPREYQPIKGDFIGQDHV